MSRTVLLLFWELNLLSTLLNFSRINKSSTLDKPKSTDLTVKVSASSKIHIKSFMEISITVSLKVMENYILLLEIIMLVSLGLIKKKEEVSTLGLERKVTFIKGSSREESEMEKELSGGQTEVGMKVSSEMEFSRVGEFFTEKVATDNMRATGITVCLTVKELSTSRTESDTREHSSRISSMVTVYSIRTIR